jgi:hypothetical protein
MMMLPAIRSHSLPVSYGSTQHGASQEIFNASAALLWVDRPFAVTAAHVFLELSQKLKKDPAGRVWLGQMELGNLDSRVLCLSHRHDLVTLRVEPEELAQLSEDARFLNPEHWPPPYARAGEEIVVLGFPRDQWPAQIAYGFRVESTSENRFAALLEQTDMPGRLAGLCGAPAFRGPLDGNGHEFVGIVVEALFHNELICCQHARHVDTCGNVPGSVEP